jgi:hypothetical protein
MSALAKFNFDEEFVNNKINEGIVEALNQSQAVLSRGIREDLSKKGTGRIYRIGKGKKKGRNKREKGYHQASSPNRPPAANTGDLRSSWMSSSVGRTVGVTKMGYAKVVRASPTRTVLQYGSNLFYAPFMEYGTRFVRPRPYLRPVLQLFKPKIKDIFRIAIAKALGKP